MFDAYQLKCIPGAEQDCHEAGFGNNDDSTCFPYEVIIGGCSDGYHSTDDDETGQCYPNEEGCLNDYILLTDRPDKGDRCAEMNYECNSESLQRFSCSPEFKINCEDNQKHYLCNGQRGINGTIYCDLLPHNVTSMCLNKDLVK
jgi:hypothetical protein